MQEIEADDRYVVSTIEIEGCSCQGLQLVIKYGRSDYYGIVVLSAG